MLDKRDIQNLMYCVRVTETSGQWQSGYPVRTPNDSTQDWHSATNGASVPMRPML